jgi:hypothetical protein
MAKNDDAGSASCGRRGAGVVEETAGRQGGQEKNGVKFLRKAVLELKIPSICPDFEKRWFR